MKKDPWWKRRWGNENICAISYTRLRPGKNVTRLECNHSFYTRALLRWIESTQGKEANCPVCRSVIKI
jgi:hypothetical protein